MAVLDTAIWMRGSSPRMTKERAFAGMTKKWRAELRQSAFQEFHSPRPGEVGCLLVVAGFGGVVVEGVVGPFVDVDLVVDLGRFERLAIALDALVDALIETGIVEKHPRLDLRHIGFRRHTAVIRHTRDKLG